MANLFELPRSLWVDGNGNPLAGGKLNFYIAGTSTRLDTYSDNALSSANANPVVANASGYWGPIYLKAQSYKVVLTDSSDVEVWSQDNVHGSVSVVGTSVTLHVATIAAMTALAKSQLTANQQVHVGGYTAIGDGGGGLFYWHDASSTTADGGTVFASDEGGTGRWKRIYEKGLINVMWFGAVGDGVTDDSTDLDNANTAALASSEDLLFPSGKNFTYDGVFQPGAGVSIYGYGATLTQLDSSEHSPNADAVIGYYDSGDATNVVIAGITVDGNFKTSGIHARLSTNLRVIDCTAVDCKAYGFSFIDCTDVYVARCRATDTRYKSDGTGPADGFYYESCVDCWTTDCYSYRPRRIGFVSEGDGTNQSDRMHFLRCVCEEPHNSDDSTTEYNAAFWSENTHNVDWIECVGINIGNGTGQSEGRRRGMTISSGQLDECVANVVRCKLYGGTDAIIGILAGGTGTLCRVNITDCYINNAARGVTTLGDLEALVIRNLYIEDLDASGSANDGGVQIDGTSTSLPYLEIDGLYITAGSFHADAGWVTFFQVPSGMTYVLKNIVGPAKHVMNTGTADKITVSNCAIEVGSASYNTFSAGNMVINQDCVFTLRSGATTTSAVNMPTASGHLHITGGRYKDIVFDIEGTSVSTFVNGGYYDNVRFDIDCDGTFINKFDGCTFDNGGADGCIRTNFDSPTLQKFIVQNCHFQSGTAANTPINKRTNDPTTVILHDNTYNTTNLHDLGVATSVVDNISSV